MVSNSLKSLCKEATPRKDGWHAVNVAADIDRKIAVSRSSRSYGVDMKVPSITLLVLFPHAYFVGAICSISMVSYDGSVGGIESDGQVLTTGSRDDSLPPAAFYATRFED